MSRLNKIILIGKVETAPNVKESTTGDSISNFTILVDRTERADGSPSQQDRIKIVAWRQVAEKSESIQPNQTVLVDGRIVTRSFDDQEGNRKYVTEVDAKELKVIQGESQSTAEVSSPSSPVLEEMPTNSSDPSFNFNDAQKNAAIDVPPDFNKEVEEDVPF